MKKLFSLIAAVLFAGSMFGADARLTLDFTQSAWGFPSANKKDAASYTNGGYTVSFGESNGGHKYLTVSKTDLTQTGIIFGKKDATLAFPALDFAVGKILVYYISAQGGANTVHNIFVGENAVSTAETGCKVTETKSYSTFNIAETAQAAGNVYVATGAERKVNAALCFESGPFTAEISDSSVAKATVSGDYVVVEGLSEGVAKLTVKNASGKSQTSVVTVRNNASEGGWL